VDRIFSRATSSVALMACAWLAAPTLARADGQGLDARALGITEAILDYCTKAYPSSAEKLQFEVQRLTRGASPEALAKVRSSDEYHKAHDSERDFVAMVDPHNAKRICSKSLVAHK